MIFHLSLLAAILAAVPALTAPAPASQHLAKLEFFADRECKTSISVVELTGNQCHKIPNAQGVRVVETSGGVKRNDIHTSKNDNCDGFDGLFPNVDAKTCYPVGDYKAVHLNCEK